MINSLHIFLQCLIHRGQASGWESLGNRAVRVLDIVKKPVDVFSNTELLPRPSPRSCRTRAEVYSAHRKDLPLWAFVSIGFEKVAAGQLLAVSQ